MKFIKFFMSVLISGLTFGAAFAQEAAPAPAPAPAKKAAAKKAPKKRAAKRKRIPRTLEKSMGVTKPASSVRPRHKQRLADKKAYAEKHGKDIKIVMLGDSITHQWEYPFSKEVNDLYMAPYNVLNLGCGSDFTHHTLYIVEKSGILELTKPKLVTILIGTNNSFGMFHHQATFIAIKRIIEGVSKRCPDAVILLHAIFPRGRGPQDQIRVLNEKVNAEIVKLCDGKKVIWFDIRKDFLTPKGILERSMMTDLLHPKKGKGYHVWGKALRPYFEKYGK